MALYVKQDFSPPVLSRRWLAMKFRPNMILYSRHNVITILESGLLFREDSIEVEEGLPVEDDSCWLTNGERAVALCTMATCFAAYPPKNLQRSTLIHLALYAAVPVIVRTFHRIACRGSLLALIDIMRDYLVLSRRAAACVKEFAAMRAELGSITSAVQSTNTMLCRQQQDMAVVMSRASSALLGNAPWLRSDLAWEAIQSSSGEIDSFFKTHHAFLVIQSTLLKHIALAHMKPPVQAQKIYKNRNERIYWMHSVLIPHLTKDFKENYEALERMYRLLKNFGNNNTNLPKKPGRLITDSWIYSEIHTGVARSNLELKLALEKCNSLDMFLDSCTLNRQEINLEILNKDLEEVIDCIIRSLDSMQNSQLRLKKLRSKIEVVDKTDNEGETVSESVSEKKMVEIDETPHAKDEVFYFVKTDDDVEAQPMADTTTMPGKKEKETTKIVLKELKRKLVKREDLMRERERQALINTMPEFKDNVPEFPRQIKVESKGKGFIAKITKKIITKNKLHKHYKKKPKKILSKEKKYKLVTNTFSKEIELNNILYEANSRTSKATFLSFIKNKNSIIITHWRKSSSPNDSTDMPSLSDGLSEMNTSALNASLEPDHSPVLELNVPEDENSLVLDQGDFQQDAFEDGSSLYFKSIFENQYGGSPSGTQNGRRHDSSLWNKCTHSLGDKSDRSDADGYKFRKEDMQLSPSSSESDFDFYCEKEPSLDDLRRLRPVRMKNKPSKTGASSSSDVQDENMRPMEYSLCAGLAMAGVLQSRAEKPVLQEEVFVAEGTVDSDSGHDD